MNILPRAENEQSGMKDVIELSRSDHWPKQEPGYFMS